MGLDIEQDFDKRSSVGLSPNTVLPTPRHCSNFEKRNVKGKPTRRDDILRVKEGFTEISFRRYRSSSCKGVTSRRTGVGSDAVELKRGSIYQCSREVRKLKKMGAIEEGKKFDLSLARTSESSLSFRVVDSFCSSDEESSKRTSLMSEISNSNATSVCESCVELSPANDYIEFRLNSDHRAKISTETAGRNMVVNQKLRCDEVVVPLNDGNDLLEKDAVLTFQKSHSAKVEMPSSPSLSDSDRSSRASSKARFSPIRRMFDPFKKSKSLRSPLGYTVHQNEIRTATVASVKEMTIQNVLSDDISNNAHKLEFDPHLHHSPVANSPVHLHGLLKLENKLGTPSFEFSLNCPEEVITAKTWKADNAFNWVYTFHSTDGRKKSNASSWGSNDSNKEPLVGQMQVSSYLCSEMKDGGVFDNSMMTEFVLYDTAHTRQSSVPHKQSKCSPDAKLKGSSPNMIQGNNESNSRSNSAKLSDNSTESNSSIKTSLGPWKSEDLRASLEVAAIVIEVPFEKRESLKCKRGHRSSNKPQSNLLNLSMLEQQKHHLDNRLTEKVKVVVPKGNHGLPSADTRGPSSLLDRWRLGGGCDCGGWDMACPLTVFDSPSLHNSAHQLLNGQQPLELIVQVSF